MADCSPAEFDERLLRARVQLVMHQPFLASAVMRMPIRMAREAIWCPPMCTDGYDVFYNPDWTAIQQTKMAMVQAAAQQLPPNLPAEVVAQQRQMFEVQVKAQFLALEAQTPPFITFEENIYVSPPETDRELLAAFNAARDAFGMSALDESAIGILGWREGEDEDQDGQDNDAEPAPNT